MGENVLLTELTAEFNIHCNENHNWRGFSSRYVLHISKQNTNKIHELFWDIRHFRKYHTKFCVNIVFNFSRDDSNSQEKLKTILMQSFLAGQKIIMVFSKVANVPKLKTMVMQNFGGDKKIIMLFSKVANSLEMVHFFLFPFFLSSHTVTFLSFFLFQTAASKTVPVSEWSP